MYVSYIQTEVWKYDLLKSTKDGTTVETQPRDPSAQCLMHYQMHLSSQGKTVTRYDLEPSDRLQRWLEFSSFVMASFDIYLYYIFEAILIPFLVIFEDDKSDNFLRGDKSFRTLKGTQSRQKQSK